VAPLLPEPISPQKEPEPITMSPSKEEKPQESTASLVENLEGAAI
jgi:hypothetical protein